ncbi:MAG TPA: carboxypeptidase-like regulatory domain-containing protein, partial [Planctomycetota bacterium]|nr:carboxypeptidase-like regulatory domain-containing protein [Planctomycetota bacterium]
MSRLLLALLAVLALTAAVAWYALAADVARPAPAPGRATSALQAPSVSSADFAPPDSATSASSPSTPAASSGTRERAAVPGAAEEALAKARWVEGRVVFPPGTPADEELHVVAYGRDLDDDGDHRARVERDGRFRVAFGERTRTGRLWLEGRYLLLREPVRWTRDQVEPPLLEPELGGRIEVRLLPPSGVELGGKLQLSRAENGNGFDFDSEIATEYVGGGDVIAFDALQAGREHSLLYEGPQLVADRARVVVEAGRTHPIDLALRAGLVVHGRVLDESGAPLSGVAVTGAVRGASGTYFHRFDASGDDGRYRLAALEVGSGQVRVRHAGYEPLEVPVEPPATGLELALDLVLRRGRSIAGSVRWPDGSPAEAQLVLTPIPGTEADGERMSVESRAAADGSFTVSGLGAGAFHLRAWDTRVTEVEHVSEVTGRARTRKQRSRWVAEVDDVAVGTRELALVLSPGLTVSGRVLDGSGAPLDDVRVRSQRLSFPRHADAEAPSGRFRNSDGSFELAGFSPGLWIVSARAGGYCVSDPVQVRVPDDGPVELRLEREATVRGVVLGLDGRPAAGVEVTVLQPGHGENRYDFYAKPNDRTDGEGAFSIDGLYGGLAHLTATALDGVPGERLDVELVPGVTLDGLVLSLRQGCSLEGQVLDRDGLPDAGVYVQLNAVDNSTFQSFMTDQEGRFEGRGLPAGPARVFAHNSDGLSLLANVELRADRVAHVRLVAPAVALVRVYGRVRSGGRPLEDAWVMARRSELDAANPVTWGAVQSPRRTDAEGSYELRVPGAGRWLVQVSQPHGGAGWTLPLDVPDVEAFEHDFDLGAGILRGCVRSAAGEPLEGISVRSEPRNHDGGARGQASTRTAADGRYELTVPVGRHTLVAGGPSGRGPATDWCAARIEDLRVEDGSSRDGLDFELARGGGLSGSVRAPGGGPARYASLWSCGAGGAELVGYSGDSGGFQLAGLPEGRLW